MKLDVFLSFNGQAEEAFRFYADLFQTEIKGLVRASEMMDPADLPAEKRDKLAWIALDTENLTLNGEDVGVFNDLSIPSNHQPNQWLVLSQIVEKKPMSSLLSLLKVDKFSILWRNKLSQSFMAA